MSSDAGRARRNGSLGEDSLARIAGSLSEVYLELYDERPFDARASLTGNLLAFVFVDGLSVADRWLLKIGQPDRLSEFRTQFFEVVSERLVSIVAGLTGVPVTYSFFGFDPQTRTTHGIFVLDLGGPEEAEERQAVLNWSEQVRRNARRLREEHVATRQVHRDLKEEVRRQREALRLQIDEKGTGPGSVGS